MSCKSDQFPPGLRLRHILSWMVGRRKRGMVANPWGFRESAEPPYHKYSPHLVPRIVRPLWVVCYYLPLWLKHTFSTMDTDRQEADR